jgi:FMN phosphatase YigB (HAD superfamily)
VLSNCDHSTRPVVERLGLYEEADAVVLSFEERTAKPEPAIYRTALSRLGVDAGDAVFVDDQVAYCDGAVDVGMTTFLIVRDDPRPGGDAIGEHRVIPDLRSLLGLI